jgi:hypothetical protein
MSRFLFALLLLAATVTAQAITPARQDADGAGGNCPGVDEIARAENAADPGAAPATPAKAGTPPAQPKAASPLSARPKSGTRWHSFLPGMFK